MNNTNTICFGKLALTEEAANSLGWAIGTYVACMRLQHPTTVQHWAVVPSLKHGGNGLLTWDDA